MQERNASHPLSEINKSIQSSTVISGDPLNIEFVANASNLTLVSLANLLRLRSSVRTEKGQEAINLSPLPKRAKRTYLVMDTDHEIIGYVVPVFRAK